MKNFIVLKGYRNLENANVVFSSTTKEDAELFCGLMKRNKEEEVYVYGVAKLLQTDVEEAQ